jgi:hypothetical protein
MGNAVRTFPCGITCSEVMAWVFIRLESVLGSAYSDLIVWNVLRQRSIFGRLANLIISCIEDQVGELVA